MKSVFPLNLGAEYLVSYKYDIGLNSNSHTLRASVYKRAPGKCRSGPDKALICFVYHY